MRRTAFAAALLWIGIAAGLQGQTTATGKTAVLNVQSAVMNTREGHQVFAALEAKFAARKAELDRKQAEIAALQDQARKGATAMSTEAQHKLAREIEKKTRVFNLEAEDAQGDYEEEQAETSQRLVQKLRAVVDKYAKDSGFAVVFDVGSPQTQAFWWANATDITNDVVRAYDAAYPPTSPMPHTGAVEGE